MMGGDLIRTDYVNTDTMSHLLWALQPCDKLICEVALHTGWRIDDILQLRTEQIEQALLKKRCTVAIIEGKTGKRSSRALPRELCSRIYQQAGKLYCFQGRDDYRKHRTRQAVFLDIKRVAKRFNIKINLSPHSFRKNYAVYLRQQGKTLQEIQKLLNHDKLETTMLYALADELSSKYL